MAGAAQALMKGLIEAFILETISRGPAHGYALAKQLADAFGAEAPRGRVYPVLVRLEKQGLIAAQAEGAGTGAPGARGRTVFALTGKGLQRLREYKLMPAAFRARISGFWGGAAPQPQGEAAGAGPVAASLGASGPSLLAPLGCREASVTLRRHPGGRTVGVVLEDCDLGNRPGCPGCPVPAMLRRAAASQFEVPGG